MYGQLQFMILLEWLYIATFLELYLPYLFESNPGL
jgi:hypothetical protein